MWGKVGQLLSNKGIADVLQKLNVPLFYIANLFEKICRWIDEYGVQYGSYFLQMIHSLLITHTSSIYGKSKVQSTIMEIQCFRKHAVKLLSPASQRCFKYPSLIRGNCCSNLS